MFKEVESYTNFAVLEEKILSFWKKNKTFEKSVSSKSEENRYVFYDGPPFISGMPHYGHLLGSIAKDIIPRYWTMQGKRVERVWGWDAHGLTVENKVTKELGIKDRKDIVDYGLEKFTQACYDYTSRISGEWQWYIDRIGRWVDMDNAYKTIDQTYMESVMWVFKSLYDKGLIYQGVRTSLYCTTCGTPVSNFEVAMDNSYKDVEDPAITMKFKIKDSGEFKGVNVLAWTTTPWTLPSNKALVVNETSNYSLVECSNEKYLLASKRVSDVFKDKKFTVIKEVLGSELVGLNYEPFYTFYTHNENDFKIYSYNSMASDDEGTGVVHSAPGFGVIDTEMGRHFNLNIMQTIDDTGSFLPGDTGQNPFEKMYYAKANKYILKDLHERGLLFKEEKIIHRFPYHDRCDTLLIQRAQKSWFIDVQSIKSDLLKNNEAINWVPSHLKEGRFAQGIEQAPDWCISRSRFWATPMPVWESEDGDQIVVSSIKELEELSGQKVVDLHRPYIDEITIEKDGKTYRRIEEVLDSWFEAGSMPYAQLHYPFENKEKFENNFPGDYIVEYIAQVRAWFYVMHVLTTAIDNTNSFKNVISTGVMAGSDGRKMSKTYGNYDDPKELLSTIGGDATRLYLMTSPLMVGGNANYDVVELKNKSKNVLNPLWNSLKFFTTYANSNNWDPGMLVASEHIMDKWINMRLEETLDTFKVNIENYLTPPAVTALEEFVDDLSRWYVRRSRDRISSGESEALSTLYTMLMKFSLIAAPAIPFITEAIYDQLNLQEKLGEESVHLCDFPLSEGTIDKALLDQMKSVRNIASLGHAIRKETELALRQPLSTMHILMASGEGDTVLSEDLIEVLKDELNIKEVLFVTSFQEGANWVTQESKDVKISIDTNLTGDLEVEGASRAMIRTIQGMRKELKLSVTDEVEVTYLKTELNENVVLKFADEIKSKVQATKLISGSAYDIKKV